MKKISSEMPLKPFCHRESICEHGMHGPHIVIGGQYRPRRCKVVSKIKELMIEIGGVEAKDVKSELQVVQGECSCLWKEFVGRLGQ